MDDTLKALVKARRELEVAKALMEPSQLQKLAKFQVENDLQLDDLDEVKAVIREHVARKLSHIDYFMCVLILDLKDTLKLRREYAISGLEQIRKNIKNMK